MNREELFEKIKTLASEERDERRKEEKEILRELKEIKELLKEKNNSKQKNSIAIAPLECISVNSLKRDTG